MSEVKTNPNVSLISIDVFNEKYRRHHTVLKSITAISVANNKLLNRFAYLSQQESMVKMMTNLNEGFRKVNEACLSIMVPCLDYRLVPTTLDHLDEMVRAADKNPTDKIVLNSNTVKLFDTLHIPQFLLDKLPQLYISTHLLWEIYPAKDGCGEVTVSGMIDKMHAERMLIGTTAIALDQIVANCRRMIEIVKEEISRVSEI